MKVTVYFLAVCLSGLAITEQSLALQEHQPAHSEDLSAVSPLTFTVASIRQSSSEEKATSNVPLTPGDSYLPLESGFVAKNQPVFAYILFAYKVRVSEAWDLLTRLPKWAVSERYDIQAKTDLTNPTKDQVREMMRSLLEERFALRTHRETVQRDVLALETRDGRLGPQLHKHTTGAPCTDQEILSREQVWTTAPTQLLGKWPVLCEGNQVHSAQRTRAGVRDQSMDSIAAWLTGEGDTDLPIVNRTGLSGNYDLTLDFAPEHGPNTPDSPYPTFAQAVPEQLGLSLKKQKGVAIVFAIDHVERPSSN